MLRYGRKFCLAVSGFQETLLLKDMVTLASLKLHKVPSLLASVPHLQYNGLSLREDRLFWESLSHDECHE